MDDQEKALRFYTELLGFVQKAASARGVPAPGAGRVVASETAVPADRAGSQVCKELVDRLGDAVQPDGFREQPRVPVLPSGVDADEAMDLLLAGACSVEGLVLHPPERRELAFTLDHSFGVGRCQRPDELVLQVGGADVEPERRELCTIEATSDARALEPTREVLLFGEIVEARESQVPSLWSEEREETSDVRGAPHRDDEDALVAKVAFAPRGHDLERDPVTDAFDENDGGRVESIPDRPLDDELRRSRARVTFRRKGAELVHRSHSPVSFRHRVEEPHKAHVTERVSNMKIKLTSIYVDDQDKAIAFYTEKLGFQKKADFSQGSFRWLTVASPEEADGTELQLALNDDPAAKTYQQAMFRQGQPAAMFFTDDLQADYERVKARGAKFTMPPTQVTGSAIAMVRDTCGNLVQLTQLSWQG